MLVITKNGHADSPHTIPMANERKRNIYKVLITVIITFALMLPNIPVMPVFAVTINAIGGAAVSSAQTATVLAFAKRTNIEKVEEEAKAKEERATNKEAGSGVTSYVFTLSPDTPTASITMRYTVDIDGDSVPDPPSIISVTTPAGVTLGISDAEMKTEEHHIIYTWTDKFLQLDVAKGENGTWTIETSDPCVFCRMPYAGTPITPKFSSGAKTESTVSEILLSIIMLFMPVFRVFSFGIIMLGATLLAYSAMEWFNKLKQGTILIGSGVFLFALSVALSAVIKDTALKTMAEEPQVPAIPKINISVSSVIFLLLIIIIILFLVHRIFFAAKNNNLHDEDDEYRDEENEGDISYDEFDLEDYRAELRGYRKKLQDKDIVNQLQLMEDTLGWIIKTTEDDPDTVFMVRRLLEYYMPKTSRLLKTYADVEKYPQKGKNISKIMTEVKEALELLNSGMENILDDMYQGKEMDISSDISVMKKMMVQDGMQEQYPDFHPRT